MPFNIGLTGLNAAASGLDVTGNNIANVDTTGFKQSRAEFGDIFAHTFTTVSKTAIGQGVRVLSVSQLFSQGSIKLTGNGLDLAVNGEGFFVLKDTDDSVVYSRAGEYQVNREGYVVNNSGQRLQGYEPVDPNDTDTTFNVGTLSDIQLTTGEAQPKATTEINALVNLTSDAEPPVNPLAAGDIDPAPDQYNFSTSVTVYDSLGTPRMATTYFVKTPNQLEWEVFVGMEDDANPGQTTLISGPDTITFTSQGEVVTPAEITIQYPGPAPATFNNGANALDMTLDLAGSTQYGVKYSVNDLNQNGWTTGRLSGIDIDETGRVFARFTNGQSEILSQVALANFTNPQGLVQLGNNNWAETFAAGDPVYGAPMTGDLGGIEAGALEQSNVDLTEELVDLIVGQRNYQANAKTIQTADAITQTIINIR
ncbi:Flagellar hook protein FlgE [Thiorhodovibrio winogradskyi]|uniref:Flagellar hook protein FlgE n=1 Tax=Thiorhodovibrio winogradskyi TaxID=77007 RepID=A0ABZ0SFF6_9GAMM|nr:flagellar hook protein FlgE [Thiorhodovibrio winogradskyi]